MPLTLLAALSTGCTRIVDLDLDTPPRQLVVEARLEAGVLAQQIRLTTTDAFSGTGAPPPAAGASVLVTDDLGTELPFAEDEAGVYRVGTAAITPGRTYTLSIVWEGEEYRAISPLVDGPAIDSLYFKFRSATLAVGDSGFRAVLDYTDPAGIKNYYFWEMFVDGERVVTTDPGNQWRVISRDRFYDGQRVAGYLPFDEKVVEPRQVVRMRQLAITEEAYQYLFAFYDQATGGGSPFSTPPASVRGNVANLTRPEHRALGFFLTADVRSRSLIVPDP
ncbi:MAG: DUF4249 domain-containing protein [Gemmatimonadota bacterium]|nr:DUF4249 domain-containing protein [Gemmatimonadota bacterium]